MPKQCLLSNTITRHNAFLQNTYEILFKSVSSSLQIMRKHTSEYKKTEPIIA